LTSRVALLLGLFLAALSLRPQLVGVGPLIPRIQADLDVSHAVVGLLGTIPVLCMGLFAPLAAYLSGRIGSRGALAGSVALIGTFGIARALVPSVAAVILLTVPVGIGMGLAGALMPVAVKERFAGRPAFVTGIYAVGINVGATLSAPLAVPLAHATNGWRGTLLVYSSFTAALPILWLVLTRGGPRHRRTGIQPIRLPWRSQLVWRLVAIFSLMGMTYYGVNAWLPDAFQERGWSEGSAGALLGVVNGCQLVPALLVPWLADRRGSRRLYLVGSAGVIGGAMLGVILVPGGGWAWAALIGLGFGALFPLTLTLPLDVAHGPAEVGAVAGMMLGVGYTIASVSPFLLGAVRDATGSFGAALWVLVATSLGALVFTATMSRERIGRGVPAPVR
jgi:CP family cyanate transporter-like MFS transporter